MSRFKDYIDRRFRNNGERIYELEQKVRQLEELILFITVEDPSNKDAMAKWLEIKH